MIDSKLYYFIKKPCGFRIEFLLLIKTFSMQTETYASSFRMVLNFSLTEKHPKENLTLKRLKQDALLLRKARSNEIVKKCS